MKVSLSYHFQKMPSHLFSRPFSQESYQSIYNIVESESDLLTRRPVDLFEKEPLKGKWEVNLHTPTKFGEDPSKDLGVHREQTNKTNAAGIIV